MERLNKTKSQFGKIGLLLSLADGTSLSLHLVDLGLIKLIYQTNSTAIILVIIIHLFNIEHGHGLPQCGGFFDLSLPCSKSLWEASDQATWEEEYRKQYMRNSKCGQKLKMIPTYKDLLPDLQDQNNWASASKRECLSDWFSSMDDLGTLVTMAVSAL